MSGVSIFCFCRDRLRCVRHNKKHRAETKGDGVVELVRLLQLSAAGERFLGGEEPPKSLSADSEIPCAMLLAHGEGG